MPPNSNNSPPKILAPRKEMERLYYGRLMANHYSSELAGFQRAHEWLVLGAP